MADKSNQKEDKSVEPILTADQERRTEELEANQSSDIQKIAERYRAGKISTDVFERLHKVALDPNKMKEDSYQSLMKSVAKGKFSEGAEKAKAFLVILATGSKDQKKAAKELLRKWSEEPEGAIAKNTIEKEIKKIKAAKGAAERSTIETTAAAVSTVIQTAETREALQKASKMRVENWKLEAIPQETIEKFKNLDLKYSRLAKLAKQDENLDQQITTESSKKIVDLQKIKRLQQKLANLDDQITKIAKEIEKVEKIWLIYMKRALSQFRALESFSKRAGLDLKSVYKLRYWLVSQLSGKSGATALRGIKIDPTSGRSQKTWQTFEITGIEFSREKDNLESESPGELKVHYIDEDGNPQTTNYKTFLGILDGTEAHEEINSLQELNKQIQEPALYKPLAEGQTFTKKVIAGFDEEGTRIYENQSFTIEDISDNKVTLNQIVTKVPRTWLAHSIDNRLYFDRNQQSFTFGEFAKFLRQHKYTRDYHEDERQDILDRMEQAQQEKMREFVQDQPENIRKRFEQINGVEAQKLTLPKRDKEQKVIFKDGNGKRRRGVLRLGDDGKYEITYKKNGSDGVWGAPTFPEAVAPIPGSPLSAANDDEYKIKFNNTGTGSWQEAVNKGDISNDPEMPEMPEPPEMPDDAETPDQTDESEEPTGPKEKKQPKFYEEALPFSAVNKVGGTSRTERSYLKSLWVSTRFLSVDDLWEMGKTMWEYYKRRRERSQKERYSALGKNLPFFGPEMQRINTSAESEQVGQFKDSYDQFGVFEAQEALLNAKSQDEMKAGITSLSERGQMVWKDIDLWKKLNEFVDPAYAIPIPSNGDPETKQSEKDGRTGFDFMRGAIDAIWGEGTFNDWYTKNKSTYASNVKGYEEEGAELETKPGGHQKQLGFLLKQHKKGEYVDPQEFEGLIQHAIGAGKSSMQAKIYYMVQGVAAKNQYGRTILEFDRMAHINGNHLGSFPILEYMTADVPRKDDPSKSHKFTVDDYRQWKTWFDEGDPMNCAPTKAVDEFMWQYAIPSDNTRDRINKALRTAEKIDHDDYYAILPPASENLVVNTCQSMAGSKKYLTVSGYANVFPGFSQYMRSLANNGKKTKLMEAFKSYVKYEGLTTNKLWKEKGDQYIRLDDRVLHSPCIVSPTKPLVFINQINTALDKIALAYKDAPGGEELYEIVSIIHGPQAEDLSDPAEKKKQDRINYAFERFSKVFNKTLKSDSGSKMKVIVEGENFEGMPYGLSDEEKDARKAAAAEDIGLD